MWCCVWSFDLKNEPQQSLKRYVDYLLRAATGWVRLWMNLFLVVCDDGGGGVSAFLYLAHHTSSRLPFGKQFRHHATWAEDTFINQNHYDRARIEGSSKQHSHSTLAYQANNTQTQNMVPEQAQLSNIISTSAYRTHLRALFPVFRNNFCTTRDFDNHIDTILLGRLYIIFSFLAENSHTQEKRDTSVKMDDSSQIHY